MGSRSGRYIGLLLVIVAAPVIGLNLVSRDSLIFTSEMVTVGDFARLDQPGSNSAVSLLPLQAEFRYPTIVSAAALQRHIDDALEVEFTLSGGSAAVIPRSYVTRVDLDILKLLLVYIRNEYLGPFDRIEIVPGETLPAIRSGETVDFAIFPRDADLHEIRYRRPGSASYKHLDVKVSVTLTRLDSVVPFRPVARVAPVRVKNGADVMVSLVSGTITAELEGKAMESGIAPDYIDVKIVATGKVINAKIVDSTEVRVVF